MSLWIQLAKYSTFETNQFLLRPFQYDDLSEFATILMDQETMQFIFPGYHTISDIEQLLVFNFIKNPLGSWAIVDKKTLSVIGAIRLENIKEDQKYTEIGYFLNKAFWRQGVMSECLKTLVFLCFQELEFRVLTIIVHQENQASFLLAKKCQFQVTSFYKGSDRYTHRMRHYYRLQLHREDYCYE